VSAGASPALEPEAFWRHVGPALFLTAIFFLNFNARIVLAPLMPSIKGDLGISHGEAGFLFLLISFGYFTTLLGSGFFSARLTHRRTIALSSLAVGSALLVVSMSEGLIGIQMSLLFLGMAAGLYLPSGIASLTSLISPRHWGKALAIHELAPNLSFVAAPLITEGLLLYFSWRNVLALLGGTTILAGLAFARFGRGGKFPGQPPTLGSIKILLVEPAFWIMIFLFTLGISGTLGVFTMLPLFLVSEQGMDREWANTLVALSRISGLGMAFLGGWASDRFGPKRTLTGVFLITGVSTIMLGAVSGPWLGIILFVQPMLAVCFFPAGFAALSLIGPPEARNIAVSLTIPSAFIVGSGVIPTAIGIAGDLSSFAFGIVGVGFLILMGSILSRFLRLPEQTKK
jgi:NNP family nitrate/nitrite transporter-like MFS transporter